MTLREWSFVVTMREVPLPGRCRVGFCWLLMNRILCVCHDQVVTHLRDTSICQRSGDMNEKRVDISCRWGCLGIFEGGFGGKQRGVKLELFQFLGKS